MGNLDAENLRQMLVAAASTYEAMTKGNNARKLICFGADGYSIFQGSR
jgi:hypothetical protein